ncbi:MAG: FAD-dependent oxidoreductase [bacterium]|nr:FAD-dependent oxidoreductase [bacterium]
MSEVLCNVGLTDAQAKLEAARCLMCEDPPCVEACPADVPVKHFIRAIRFDSPRRAINLIRERNVFAGVCGLACPVDDLCVGACSATELSKPIDIGKLQHYAAVTELQLGREAARGPGNGRRVAVIGGGPAGLAAAAELAVLGHAPVVFERNRRAGGVCTYGVRGARLPKELVAAEIAHIEALGVEIKTNAPFGDGQTLDDLLKDFDAVYVSAGANQPLTPKLPGEDLQGVTTWKKMLNEFAAYTLGDGPKPDMPSRVIIIGGGSVAMDAAGAAHDLEAQDIEVLCLESPREMPAYHAELDEAWEAGVRFHTRSMPLEITGAGGKVSGLRAVRIRWNEPDKFVPANAVPLEGTEYWLPADMIVLAIGAQPAPALAEALPGVALDRSGRIVADAESGATSRPGVFAGGDVVAAGGMTIVNSVAEGKRAGQAIDAYLREKGTG